MPGYGKPNDRRKISEEIDRLVESGVTEIDVRELAKALNMTISQTSMLLREHVSDKYELKKSPKLVMHRYIPTWKVIPRVK